MKTYNIIIFAILATICIGCEPINQPTTAEHGFSVSPTNKVIFSSGNLQYHPAMDKWRFAEHHYDYIGEDNINISKDYKGWIDLFGWGTGNNPTLNTIDTRHYTTFTDWGINSISGYPQNTWRTLTADEWEYLIYKRQNAYAYMAVAQVNGTNGLILLPDNWVAPKDIVIASGMNTYVPGENYNYDYAAYQTFTATEWKKLEQNGAVFLPAAGWRSSDGVYGTTTIVLSVQEQGRYWSASYTTPEDACLLDFNGSDLYVTTTYNVYGYSIRLVKDL